MKKIIALAALPFLATPAMSDEIEVCIAHSELAASMMELRQSGIPMATAISHFRSDPDLDADTVEMLTKLTEVTYKTPFYHSQDYKAREIARFSDLMFSTCRGG